MRVRFARWRRPAVVVVLLGVLLASALGLGTRSLEQRQSAELLDRRAREVTALLATDLDQIQSTIRSLRPIIEFDQTGETFMASSSPHLHGRVRAIAAVRPDTEGSFVVVSAVGDGLPDPRRLDDTRAALATRALATPDLVTGVITDEWRRRVVIAQGPAPGGADLVLWHESAVDPNLPHPLSDEEPFSDLHVALYASAVADPDALVLRSDPASESSGDRVEVPLPVGRDRWLVQVSADGSLIGTSAEVLPEVAFGAVLLAALAAGAVTEVLRRRRDYALVLVDERTAELQLALERAEHAQRELTHRVLYDSLTGLPTRTLLNERLKHALARTRRSQSGFALIFCDLDRFKLVNDTLGHAAGDRLLQVIAQRIEHAARREDTVARFGGDEFVVLCESASGIDDALTVARRIADEIRIPLVLHGQQLSVTASMGVALGDAGADGELLLRRADTAMYRAKERGRDRVQIFDDGLALRAEQQFHTEQSLRTAIAEGSLEVHYQPIVSLRGHDRGRVGDGAIPAPVGVEALVRWPASDGTFLMPDRFIPLAEDTGLIIPLDRFVLREACTFVSGLDAGPSGDPITLSVNISARLLGSPDLVHVVHDVLEETGLDPARLWIELTESGLVENLEDSRGRLMALRELGVRIAVDDFGTGWSSLVYLRLLPIDVIKIDRTFVSGVARSHEDRAIVSAVVALAESLGLETVAEGVEDDRQAEILRELGCTRAQGYFWSSAAPADVIRSMTDHGRADGLEHFPGAAAAR